MNRRAAPLLALLLLVALLPGFVELVENAAHLVLEGHFAHGEAQGDAHQAPGPEHGCTGSTHICACCQTAPATAAKSPARRAVLQPEQTLACLPGLIPRDSYAPSIEHPPRA